MFKFNKPEFVVISTPTETHKKVFDEIAKYNSVKLILFEKPISYNLNDLKKIHFISKKKRIKIFINYIRRSNKDFQRLKKKIQIKSKNIKINIFYNNGFINNGIHYLNLLIFYFGKVIKYKILKIKNKLGKDFNLDLLILFKNAEAKFFYKSNSVDKDLEIKINKNVLINYKKKGIYYNKKKIGNNLNFYQKDIVEQIYRYYKKKKYFLCNFKEHFNDMKLIEQIKNEI